MPQTKDFQIPTPPVTPERTYGNKSNTPKQDKRKYRMSMSPFWIRLCLLYSILAILYWAKITYDFSSESNPNYNSFRYKLQDGWLFSSRKMDNSDGQYAGFRNNIPILILVMFGHLAISKIASLLVSNTASGRPYQAIRSKSQNNIPNFRHLYTLAFSIVFLTALYGASILKILALILVNYGLAKSLKKSKLAIVLAWTYCIGILFLNHAYEGYKFGMISPLLGFLDSINGVGLRWHITFNFTILRMISFTMDYYWAMDKTKRNAIFEKEHAFDCKDCDGEISEICEKSRIQKSRSLQEYNLFNYMCYSLYAPLYMAGPIISFNNFTAQMNHSPNSIKIKNTILYGLRWIGAAFLMEIMMHLFYLIAIKDTKSWKGFSSLEIFTLGYFNLNFIWIKLLIIWRFFRLWALADGIQTQENMITCMSNNHSGVAFWRGWHASYNKWLIRYLYIPLGGSSNRIINSLIIFTFVALWHDIELKLLAWGWLIVLFIIPEVACTSYFCTAEMRKYFGNWHLHLCSLGGLLNIWMMMTANLVGFAVGVDGMLEMGSQLLQPKGALLIFWVSTVLLAFVHIQFKAQSK